MFMRLGIVGLVVVLWPQLAGAVTLQSHVGVYELAMSKNRSDSGISGVSGRLVLRVVESCDGFTQSQRMILVTTSADGQEVVRDFNFESVESRDGTDIQFDSSDTANGALQGHHVGRAELDERGGEGMVVFTKPQREAVSLEPGTIFPTEHFVVLIEAARVGQTTVERRVFDGSGPNGIYDAVAQISKPVTPSRDQAVTPQLADDAAWNVHVAYFKPATDGILPEYEIGFRLHDNGIASDLDLDYGTFALRASLSRLDFLPDTCN
jgi:hypothetical protein